MTTAIILQIIATALALIAYLGERRDRIQYESALNQIGLAVYEYQSLPDWESRDHIVAMAERYSHSNEQGNPLIAQYEEEFWAEWDAEEDAQ